MMQQQVMQYGSFWQRVAAKAIDVVVMLPLVILSGYGLYASSTLFLLYLIVPVLVIGIAYPVYFHGRWGATLGKKAMSIKVTNLDGSPIDYKQAYVRGIVQYSLNMLTSAAIFLTVLNASEQLNMMSVIEKSQYIKHHKPTGLSWSEPVGTAWLFIDSLVFFFNKKKRTIHDFIGGTVVIRNVPRHN